MALSIGELSERTQVKIPTIRYYEEIGLLRDVPRTPGRQRRYAEEDAERLIFIRRVRALGFEIEEIDALLKIDFNQLPEAADRAELLSRFVEAVDERIGRLRALGEGLRDLAAGSAEAPEGRLLKVLAKT